MIIPLVFRKRLAGLIWAAIFVAAVQLVPSTAQAHAGHEHHSLVTMSFASHVTAEHHAIELAQRPADEMALMMQAQQDQYSSVPSTGCTGGCCGTGVSCCGAALHVTPNSLPDLGRLSEILCVVFDARAGVDPDALARPPRTFA
jgi:hypothetical protein